MESLRNRFRHPHQHTSAEIKLLYDTRRRNPDADLVVFWVKLRQRGAAPSPAFLENGRVRGWSCTSAKPKVYSQAI